MVEVSLKDFRSPLSQAEAWNETKAAWHYKRSLIEKNNFRREQHQRDGNRHTRNAMAIRKTKRSS